MSNWYTHNDSGFLYESEDAHNPLAVFANPDHAKRIVACVNACAGIDTYCLENHSFRSERDACLQAIEQLKAERDAYKERIAAMNAYSDRLDAIEQPPNGDDFNNLFDILGGMDRDPAELSR